MAVRSETSTTPQPGPWSDGRARAHRLRSLLLSADPPRPDAPRPGSVAEVVEWFGAMQARDYGSALWSLGLRLPAADRAAIEAALERREALRTWPMRGTVHLVPPGDARWMLTLMVRRPLAAGVRVRQHLGLSELMCDRAADVLGGALAGGRRLTRTQCLDVLRASGLPVDGQRGYHLLTYAAQRGVVCLAPNRGTEQTFVLLADWAPDQADPDEDEALRRLAVRYVRSHGPVPVHDFAGWTGLPLGACRRGVAAAASELAAVEIDGRSMLATAESLDRTSAADGDVGADDVLLVAGFDEFLLGYKDRSLVLAEEHKAAVVPGGNGVFAWTVVRAGRVVGTWKRTIGARTVRIDVRLLGRDSARLRRLVERAAAGYGAFVGLPVEVRWP